MLDSKRKNGGKTHLDLIFTASRRKKGRLVHLNSQKSRSKRKNRTLVLLDWPGAVMFMPERFELI